MQKYVVEIIMTLIMIIMIAILYLIHKQFIIQ